MFASKGYMLVFSHSVDCHMNQRKRCCHTNSDKWFCQNHVIHPYKLQNRATDGSDFFAW